MQRPISAPKRRYPKPFFRPQRGLWYIQIDGKQHGLGRCRDAEEADERAVELKKRLREAPPEPPPPPPPDPEQQRVVEVLDLFLSWCQANKAPRTYEWYLLRLQSFATFAVEGKYAVKDLAVGACRPFHVEDWLAGRDDWTPGMKRGAMIAVQRAFNWAAKSGRIDRSPVSGLEKPPAGRREFVITPDLYRTILSHVRDEPFRDLLTLAWETGARPQELLALEARHVDLANARLVFPTSEAKGKRRVRAVYLTEPCLRIVERLAVKHAVGRLLRNVDGVPWKRFAVNCRFCRLKEKVGVKLCLYHFRHAFATRMLEQGTDALVVGSLMGHSDLSMLGRVYAHLQNGEHLRRSLGKASA